MNKRSGVNFHIHSKDGSDGLLTRVEFCRLAERHNVKYIAFTDHNYIPSDEELQLLKNQFKTLQIIRGCEFSTVAELDEHRFEAHVIGLNFTPSQEMKELVSANTLPEALQREYINQLISSVQAAGLNCSVTYDTLKQYYPERRIISRSHLADALLIENKKLKSRKEVFDFYIGDRMPNTMRKANYIPKPLVYPSLARIVELVHNCGGTAILCHPFGYRLSDENVTKLISMFAAIGKRTGGRTAVEVFYARYGDSIQSSLKCRADQADPPLLYSAGTDFHSLEDKVCTCYDPKIAYDLLGIER